ncbi:hypothetical protein E1176_12400 [Fulvivirga sp. RKSG066]|uniref:DUF6249 domain-containing protein n=1 Tax=Fulvivirga aurantia TaxID=2529383 RepID=UPI0012BC4B15|nr:DUF6249 domain-containing protein [Fulvivirga aurantia]MTI21824.1 hypothetical protein [Fulvivirga aurantia]
MDVAVIGVFIPIVALVGIVITIIYLRRYKNEERMAMIEKGLNPGDLDLKSLTDQKTSAIWPLRSALLLMGIGVGLFIGYFLDAQTRMEEVAYFSMLFLFGGIGLAISYMIEERKLKQAQK